VDAAGVIYRIRRLIAAPRELQRLQRHAKRLGRPRAAADILKIVLAQNPL
jgi:UDP-N-acetylglucosamine:LPS N-acetylglucosamine transferase